MKILPKTLKIFSTLIFLIVFFAQAVLAANFDQLIILHTNDTHGFDMYGDGHNGLAMLKSLKEEYQGQGFTVLLLDGGDAIQDNTLVNFSKGKSAIVFFNQVGYDAAVLGNHEFDYGQEVLLDRIKEARYPILSNIIYEDTKKTFTKPSVIIHKNDISIGIIGLTTPSTKVTTNAMNVKGLKFFEGQELYKNTQSMVNDLKKQGCELIIVLGHMGSEDSYIGNRSDDILANVEGIDIFIDGHDHEVKNRYINDTLLAEAGCHTNNIGRIIYEKGKWVEKMIPFGEYTKEDPTVKKMMEKAQEEIDAHFSQVIGKSEVELFAGREEGVRVKETNLGDFIADAYLWQARESFPRAQAAIVNGGGIRKEIARGAISRGDIRAVQPYNGQLFLVTLKGDTLLEILEAATSTLPEALGAFPQVAGIKYSVDTTQPYIKGEKYPGSVFFAPARKGQRVTIEEVAGRKFSPKETYNIVMTDFIALGGDAYGALTRPGAILNKQELNCIDVIAIENYLREHLKGTIGKEYLSPQGRITIKK